MLAWLDFDTEYLFYGFIGVSAFLLFEAVYLLFFQSASYRKSINRRIDLLKDQTDREGVLVQLRRERGLTSGGDYRLPVEAINRLILQSGLSLGVGKLAIYVRRDRDRDDGRWYTGASAICSIAPALSCSSCTLGPLLWLKILRGRRQKKFGAQFPDALDIIVRSLARRPSGAGGDHHGRPRIAGSLRHRIRHRRRRSHLRLRSRRRDAQSLFPRRTGRPAAVRHRGRDPGLDRRQSRRNPGEPVGA